MLKINKVIESETALLFPLSSRKVINPFKMYAKRMLIRIGAKIAPKKYSTRRPINRKKRAA